MKNNYLKNKQNAFSTLAVNWVVVMFVCASVFFTKNTFAQAPPAPVAASATNITCNSFNANWSPVGGAVSYFLDLSTDVNFGTFVVGFNNSNVGNVSTYNITGLNSIFTYYYRVRAYDGSNTSLNSNVIVALGVTLAPTALSATNVSCTAFTAVWSTSPNALSYSLDVSTDALFTSTLPSYNDLNVGNVTTYTVTGLMANSNYYYRLRADDGCTGSLNSNTISVLTGAPIAPVALTVTNQTCTSVDINWGAVAGAVSYSIDISNDISFSNFLPGYSNFNAGSATTLNVTGLTLNTNYYYRVRASNSCATSLNSNTIFFTTNAVSTPVALNVINVGCSYAEAIWNSALNATHYLIDVSTDPTFSPGNFLVGYNNLMLGADTSHVIVGLINGPIYYYRIMASNGCTNSNSSNVISFSTSGSSNPNPPIALAATNVNCSTFDANWSAVSGGLSYFLDVSTATNFSTFVTTYNNLNVGNVTTYNLTGLTANTTYYYRVRVQDGCGTSTNSNTITVNSSSTDAPIALSPSSVFCTAFTAAWMPVQGGLQYFIDVSTDATFGSFLAGYNNLNVGNVTTYSVSGLTIQTIYYYRVRVFSSCNTSTNSNIIAVSTSGPLAPTALAPSNETCTSFNANWSALSDATNYFLDVSTSSTFTTFQTGYNNLNVGNVTTLNVTGLTLTITYYYRVRAANGCSVSSNSNTDSVTIGNGATLSSTLSPAPICGGSAFNYIPTSSTPGTTFAWTRAAVVGISNNAGSGTGGISETLIDTTDNPVNVTYVYTLTANGCTGSASYSVVVTVNPLPTLSSVLIAPDVYTGTAFNYTPTSATVGTTFSWTRATVAGISNLANAGTGNPNETLVNTTNAPIVVEYLYTLTANGCTNSNTDTVQVKVVPFVVWPGDANNDMVVNNFDLLPLGVHFSQTGTPRASTGNIWQAYMATNWGSTQNNGEDLMHVDCNGNGTIDNDDTLAINQNFSLTHLVSTPPVEIYSNERTTPDMYFVINSSAFTAGDWVPVELWLGSSSAPLTNIYGLAFNIQYDQSLVENATESITYATNWLGTPGTDMLTISKIDAMANTAYGAMVRNDQTSRSGYGKVADFKFQVSNAITADDTIKFSISSYMVIDSVGTAQTITIGTDTVWVSPLGTGIANRKVENTVSIAPNPFSTNTTITFNTEVQNATVKVFDVVGKEVKVVNFSGKDFTLEKGDLNAGIYSVKIIASNQSVIANQKIVIR